MSRPRPVPGRLRRRLAIAFALVGAVSCGLLAAGTYLVVERSRMDDARDRALVQADVNLKLARASRSLGALQRRLQSRPGFVTVPLSASTAVGRLRAPPDLAARVRDGNLAYQWTTAGGKRYLVVGAPTHLGPVAFFFDEQQLEDDLDALKLILFVAWLVLAVCSALVGVVLSRRVLAPVGEASAAARALAEGLLETRIQRTGRDEFGEWADSFNRMAGALESKIADLSEARERERRFTADVAHELRTPLTALVNEAAILRDHLDRMPADAQQASRLLTEDVGRLSRLVEDLLEISRLDAQAEPLAAEPVDLARLVDALVADNGWAEQVATDVAVPPFRSDRRRLERVVGNLLANAVTHGGGGVLVTARLLDRHVRLTVADRGPGVPPDRRPAVFDRFVKGDAARGGGSGLGLAIAREHARAMGGDIVLDDTPAGASFTVTLPVAEALRTGDPAVALPADDGDMSTSKGSVR